MKSLQGTTAILTLQFLSHSNLDLGADVVCFLIKGSRSGCTSIILHILPTIFILVIPALKNLIPFYVCGLQFELSVSLTLREQQDKG